MARWTTARAVSVGADFRSRVDSPTLSPEKESTGRVASLQETEREVEFAFEFVDNLVGNLNLEVDGLERKIEEEKKEREVEVGVGVDSAAILSSVAKAFYSTLVLLLLSYPFKSLGSRGNC